MDAKREALKKLWWAFVLQELLISLYLVYEFRVYENIAPLFSGSFWDRWIDLGTNLYFDIPYYALAYGVIYLYYSHKMSLQRG